MECVLLWEYVGVRERSDGAAVKVGKPEVQRLLSKIKWKP